jgi:hypothetical protein
VYDISCLNTTALPKRLKWLRLFQIEVHYSVRVEFGSVCTDGENKRRMNKWDSDGGICCVITMWVEFWNELGTQTSREICVQQNSAIWRTCTPEICRHGCSRKGQILCFNNSAIYKVRVALDCIILCAICSTLKRITRFVTLQIPSRSFDSASEAKLTYVSVTLVQSSFSIKGLRSCKDARVPCKR